SGAYAETAWVAGAGRGGGGVRPWQVQGAAPSGAGSARGPGRTLLRRARAPGRPLGVRDGEAGKAAVGPGTHGRRSVALAALAAADDCRRAAARGRLSRGIQRRAARSREREGDRAATSGLGGDRGRSDLADPPWIRRRPASAGARPAHRAADPRAPGALVAVRRAGGHRRSAMGGTARDRHVAIGRATGGRGAIRAPAAGLEVVGHLGPRHGSGGKGRPALRSAALAGRPRFPARARTASPDVLADPSFARSRTGWMGREP